MKAVKNLLTSFLITINSKIVSTMEYEECVERCFAYESCHNKAESEVEDGK